MIINSNATNEMFLENSNIYECTVNFSTIYKFHLLMVKRLTKLQKF